MMGFKEFLEHASWPFYVNIIVSVFAIATILERLFMLLVRYSFDGKSFMQNIERYVLANDLTQAINYCNTSQAPLATVVKAGLVKANRGGMAISMGIDESLLQTTPQIEKRIGTLWSYANIATLIGLIGTILGLITSFRAVSIATPEQKAELLGKGIAEAMFNTAFGLTIAVTCIFFHLMLAGIAKKYIGDLDYYSSRLENLLTLRQDADKAA